MLKNIKLPQEGEEACQTDAQIWKDFFKKYLADFNVPDLSPLGRDIITCCLDEGSVTDYEALITLR